MHNFLCLNFEIFYIFLFSLLLVDNVNMGYKSINLSLYCTLSLRTLCIGMKILELLLTHSFEISKTLYYVMYFFPNWLIP